MNVGFVSYWFERGQAYVTKALIDAIGDHTAFILARSPGGDMTKSDGEWAYPNLSAYHKYAIPPEVMHKWIQENNLGIVFFNEESLEEYGFNLVKSVHDAGIKTVGIYYWELFNPSWARRADSVFDTIICPTRCCFDKFTKLGMKNIVYVPWGVDLSVFKPSGEDHEGVRFFHPAGWGGMHARRGTEFVIEAFKKINDPRAELIIHSQKELNMADEGGISFVCGTIPRDALVATYQAADVAVLPSKWEGIGLTLLESLACGLPVITTDAAPMNEFVKDDYNGLCVDGEMVWYDDIYVPGVHADIDDMVDAMETLCYPGILADMKSNAIKLSRELLDWGLNGSRFTAIIDELAGEIESETKQAIRTVIELVEYEYSTPVDARQYARYDKILADEALKGDVLEIGCRHGTLAFRIAEVANVVGIDCDAESVKLAQQTGSMIAHFPVNFQTAAINSLPFPDDSFDTIIMSKVLEHIDNPEDLAEVSRVLKPTGTIIVVTNLLFAHWDPDHAWFFVPKEVYELLNYGWMFRDLQTTGEVVAFEDFINDHFNLPFGYQIYNEHESVHNSLEIYCHVYGTEAKWLPFPELDGEDVWIEDNRCGIEPAIPFTFAQTKQQQGGQNAKNY